ncbi:GPO family capsid scaffolding protein [Pseudoalteromonas luteoviolacea]|uniref:GPO family capsid scaffolding protein n=1 Tax=Pseudoalteromonas luteoviolacea TaxID=43657 RepID=UPI001B382D5C|nr:GPO family capsid scaffolding protein [Pseudoalteromonas luteoviolacea]MBQ4836788.1 GPO family capsid scaffolding protein [Pseudoalteromonas luteoviolacea]
MPSQLRTEPLAIAAVGMTVDGREITEKDIDDIVATYNPRMYGARINLDHEFNWSGWAAKHLHNIDIPGMLGDVISVEKKANSEGVQCLYGVLAPNQGFIELNKADQAVYFSIEITPDFMGTEKTYLVGLAVTDYPASLYTDRINFSDENREENKDVSLLQVNLGIQEQPKKKGFLGHLFNRDDKMPLSEDDAKQMGSAVAEALKPTLDELSAQFSKFKKDGEQSPPNQQDDSSELMEKLNSLADELKEVKQEFSELKDKPHGRTPADEEPEGNSNVYNVL